VTLTFPAGSGPANLLADDVYTHLSEFDLFNNRDATARLDGNIIYFDSLGILGAMADMENPNEVAVARVLSPADRQVSGVTLGTHMLVGIRRWRVQVVSSSPATLEITTEAYEQARGFENYEGGQMFARSKQLEIWTEYLQNIASYYSGSLGATSSGITVDPIGLSSSPNPWRSALPPELQ
jgi:hypothetical protein